MPLQKTSVFVPFGGALDSQKAPLSMPSTSLLTCDNVTQERRGEFRRRYGFTQTAGDSLASISASCPSQVATMGQGATGQGMVALMDTNQLAQFDTITGTWTALTPFTPRASTATRSALVMSNDIPATQAGFASDGSEFVCSSKRVNGILGGGAPQILANFGKVGNPALDTDGTVLDLAVNINVVRCAALPGFLCIFWSDTSGNLKVRVRNSSTGAFSAVTTVKTGLHLTNPMLDAMYYTGSTITLACQLATTVIQGIGFNPSTLANAFDTAWTGAATISCMSLIADPGVSGKAYLGYSATVPTTAVGAYNAVTGALFTTSVVEAIQSTQITGCTTGASGDFAVVYQVGGALKRQTRIAGVMGTPAFVDNVLVGVLGTIASNRWGFSGDSLWYFLVAQNDATVAGFQQTAIAMSSTFTAATSDFIITPVASVAPLGSGPTPTTSGYQVMSTGTRTFALGMPVATSFANVVSAISADYVILLVHVHAHHRERHQRQHRQAGLSQWEAHLLRREPIDRRRNAIAPDRNVLSATGSYGGGKRYRRFAHGSCYVRMGTRHRDGHPRWAAVARAAVGPGDCDAHGRSADRRGQRLILADGVLLPVPTNQVVSLGSERQRSDADEGQLRHRRGDGSRYVGVH